MQNDQAQFRERTQLRNARYGEVLLVHRHGIRVMADVYNTLGLNECPDAEWHQLQVASIKAAFHATAVLLNGPRYFMMDTNALKVDPAQIDDITTFGTLQMRKLATVDLTLRDVIGSRQARKPYTGHTVRRTTAYGYQAGKKVYELLATDGSIYILQSYALIVDPTLTEQSLDTLGDRLKLPKGWRYRVRTLAGDEVVRAEETAIVLQDELQNSYQRVDIS